MNYSNDPAMVRVDIFRESGKWYTTVQMKWDRYRTNDRSKTELIADTFARCVREQFPGMWEGMFAVCLEPYHENSFPLMIKL